MKRIIVSAGIAASLVACAYPSYNEAMDACEKWSKEGGSYTDIFVNAYGDKVNQKFNIRYCIKDGDDSTRVVLGRIFPNIKDGEVFYNLQKTNSKEVTEVAKRFHY